MARRRGSNEQRGRLLVAATRGGPRALSGSGCGGPTARAAAAARGCGGRRAAETMVSAGSRVEWARGSPGRRLRLRSREWAVSRGRAGAPAVPDSAWGGPHGTREAEAGRRALRCTEEVGLLRCEFPQAQGLRNAPAEDRSSDPHSRSPVRGLPVTLCNRSFLSWLHLRVFVFGSLDLVESGS